MLMSLSLSAHKCQQFWSTSFNFFFFFSFYTTCLIFLLFFNEVWEESTHPLDKSTAVILWQKDLLLNVRLSALLQGRCSSDSRSSEEAGGGGSHAGGYQTQTVVQSQPCRALSAGIEIETALQEMEMQTHQTHMCSSHCSPGEYFEY